MRGEWVLRGKLQSHYLIRFLISVILLPPIPLPIEAKHSVALGSC